MIDWTPYLKSVCTKYAQWWDVYTLTDVAGKTRLPKTKLLLEDFWVQSIEREREKPGEREEKKEKIERFTVLEGLRKYAINHVLLVGRPGSGKSTALARLLSEEAVKLDFPILDTNEQSNSPLSKGGRGGSIPILVELRYYQTSIFDLILQFLQRHELIIDRNTLENLLLGHDNVIGHSSNLLGHSSAMPLLLFDGINELPSDEARRDLQQFRQQYQKIPMIFTTRDIGIGGDLNIEKKLEMLPLNESQMRDFVRAYLQEKGEKMLKQLGTRLKEFGQTPLLLWMLCSVFESNESQILANLGLVFQRFTEIYDHRLKADVPTYQESRDWWRELLQILAWKMTQGDSKTEIQVAISQREAEAVLRKFLREKVAYPDNCAKQWLKDLLKHHLIQLESNEQIAFRHQLIQEYYTAEALSEKLPRLSDEELQWDYLNYLKWTEPVALMLGMLEKKADAIRVIKLALEVDVRLGARLVGEVKEDWQESTVNLIINLNLPELFKVLLLDDTKSDSKTVGIELIKALNSPENNVRSFAARSLGGYHPQTQIMKDKVINELIKILEDPDCNVSYEAANSLGKINSKSSIEGLINGLKSNNSYVRFNVIAVLGDIRSEVAIPALCEALKDPSYEIRFVVADALGKISSKAAIPSLVKALEDTKNDVVGRAEDALVNIGLKVGIPALLKVLNVSKYNNNIKSHVSRVLMRIDSEELRKKEIDDVIYDFSGFYEGVHAQLKAKFININLEERITQLNQKLEDPNPNVRIEAVQQLREIISLDKIVSEVAIPGLLKALEDSDDYVREIAAISLCYIESEALIPVLIRLLENPWFSNLAKEALVNIGSEVVINQLIDCLKNSDWVGLKNEHIFFNSIFAIKTIQNKLKYYHPIPETIKSSLESTSNPESKYNIYAKNVQIIEQGDGKIQNSSS